MGASLEESVDVGFPVDLALHPVLLNLLRVDNLEGHHKLFLAGLGQVHMPKLPFPQRLPYLEISVQPPLVPVT